MATSGDNPIVYLITGIVRWQYWGWAEILVALNSPFVVSKLEQAGENLSTARSKMNELFQKEGRN